MKLIGDDRCLIGASGVNPGSALRRQVKVVYPREPSSTASAPAFRNRFALLGYQLKMVPCPRVNNDISARLFHKMLAHFHVVPSRSQKYPNKLIYQPQMTPREHVRIFEIIQSTSNNLTDLSGGIQFSTPFLRHSKQKVQSAQPQEGTNQV